MRTLCICIILFAACFPSRSMAEESSGVTVPEGILYQGRLKDDGLHVTGTRDLTVAIYAADSGGDALWTESHSGVPVVSGLFQIVLGSEEALSATALAGGPRWLELQISGGPTLPRQALHSSPYARVAGLAAGVAEGSIERQALGSDLASELDALQDGMADLLARMEAVESKTESMEVVELDNHPTLRFSGVNVQIVSGSGGTYGPGNGRGNLIIGYNAHADPEEPADRSGSHNLIVGDWHTYPQSARGAVVFGRENTVSNEGATVVGGHNNRASGLRAMVAGGSSNTASSSQGVVVGGTGNTATALNAMVAGGFDNTASGWESLVAGGRDNRASGRESVIVGGQNNEASGIVALVAGGRNNTASGAYSTFLGGGAFSSSADVSTNYATGARNFQSSASATWP